MKNYRFKGFVFFYFISWGLNIVQFLHGNVPSNKGTFSSIIFVLTWVIYGFNERHNSKWLVFSISALTFSLLLGISAVFITKMNLIAPMAALFYIPFLVPFYGFNAFDCLNHIYLYIYLPLGLDLVYLFLYFKMASANKQD